ncbi:uncharacterized protein LOC141655620 [Silene latifolia]|uniref:uncharacterized protein LOC141655620 n=1 Tax=Silene latifolia TaxID=37657 RepID=UPI003D7892EE
MSSFADTDEQRNPEVTVLGFMRLVQEYNGYMQRVGGANCPRQEIGEVQWLKPDVGVIKINTDAVVLEDGSVGLGVVARDCHGGVLLVASKRVRAAWDVDVAESKAMAYGLELAYNNGFTQVVIESGALNVVRAVSKRVEVRSPLSLCIQEVQVLASNPICRGFCHIKRNGNTVAHLCARLCENIGDEQVYVTDFPEAVQVVADIDLI